MGPGGPLMGQGEGEIVKDFQMDQRLAGVFSGICMVWRTFFQAIYEVWTVHCLFIVFALSYNSAERETLACQKLICMLVT